MKNWNIVGNLMTLDGLHKILFGIVATVIVLGCSLTGTITNVNTQKATGLGATSNTIIVSPRYTEDDTTTSQKAIIVNGTIHARTVTFSGHGMAKGVNYTDGGEGLIIPRGFSGVIEGKGWSYEN